MCLSPCALTNLMPPLSVLCSLGFATASSPLCPLPAWSTELGTQSIHIEWSGSVNSVCLHFTSLSHKGGKPRRRGAPEALEQQWRGQLPPHRSPQAPKGFPHTVLKPASSTAGRGGTQTSCCQKPQQQIDQWLRAKVTLTKTRAGVGGSPRERAPALCRSQP